MTKLRNLERFVFRVLSGCCVLAVSAFTVHAQPLTFTTLAGPAGGPGSLDGTGSAARFNGPGGIATESGGNIFVADTVNHTIRKITPAGGVTTLAGLAGVSGSADGAGSAARFRSPIGVAADSAGNIYVADSENNTIRKITSAGVMSTLAGSANDPPDGTDGTGSAARFNAPTGVATDSAGNIYVADSGNNTIRKITPAGVVTTLAGLAGFGGSADGTGSVARFESPLAVASDANGNVYAADSGNHTIRRITRAGVVTTLAGLPNFVGSADGTGSAARFYYPRGVAIDGGGNVYAADTVNNTIRKITSAGVVTTLAGSAGLYGNSDGTGSAARFGTAQGVAADSAGNIYIADTSNFAIRKITPAGVVTTLAGSPNFFGSADGNADAARFDYPGSVAADSAGNLYVADTPNHTIRKITSAGVVTTLAGSAGSSGSADGTGSAGRFSSPGGVATDSAGNIYVADTYNQLVRKITPAGVVTTLAGSAGSLGSADGTGNAARFGYPEGVATDSARNVYVADTYNHTIRKITPSGVVTTLAGSAGSSGIADGTGSAARFNSPEGVATDGAGNIYVADLSNHTIRKITPSGVVTTLAGSAGSPGSADGTGNAAHFRSPIGVATDNAGNIYVADASSSTIRKITPAGVVTTVAGSAGLPGSEDGTGDAARFDSPFGVAADSAGNIYVADRHNNKIRVGRPALADAAVVDVATGAAFTTRQLSTSSQTATSWQWRIIRKPSGSNATLSSISIRNPDFAPDVADLYIFQLTASDGLKTSITTVGLTATPAQVPPKRRAVGRNTP